MKSCPHCAEPPGWHFASNVSRARKVVCFAFVGCKHANDFRGAVFYVTPDKERAAFEDKWDAHAESMFALYTARWTDAERVSFRARLWPEPVPVVPAVLFVSEVGGNEAPAPAFRHAVEANDDCPWDENAR
jgi:hypothetical protein